MMTKSDMKPKRIRKISIEGFRPEEIVALPDDQIHEYVFQGDHVVFVVGTVEIHGEFRRQDDRLVALLTQISHAGEDIIPSVAALLSRYARLRQIPRIDWEIHTNTNAERDGNLEQALAERGFRVEIDSVGGKIYRMTQEVDA